MKFMEITGGYFLPLTGDEQCLIQVLEKEDLVWEEDLDDFAAQMAEKMVGKGLLCRITKNDRNGYRPNIKGENDE